MRVQPSGPDLTTSAALERAIVTLSDPRRYRALVEGRKADDLMWAQRWADIERSGGCTIERRLEIDRMHGWHPTKRTLRIAALAREILGGK